MKLPSLYTIIIIAAAVCLGSQTFAAPKLTIREATKECEKIVPNYCVQTSCPAFCTAINKNRRNNKEQLIADCKKDCTTNKRCVIKPLGGRDDPNNRELDAQNREQLIACIAQLRDPDNVSSGRRNQDWKTIETPSWSKLMGK